MGKFQPGHPKVGGRTAGTPNVSTLEVRRIARRLVRDRTYVARLKQRLLDGTAGRIETELWHYAYGRPPDDDTSGPVRIVVEYEDRPAPGTYATPNGWPVDTDATDDGAA